jgi:hypothetical protein
MILSVFHLRRGFLEGEGTVTALAECLFINDIAPVKILADYVFLFGIRGEHCRAVHHLHHCRPLTRLRRLYSPQSPESWGLGLR